MEKMNFQTKKVDFQKKKVWIVSLLWIQSIIYATGQADQKQSWQLSQPPILIKFLDLHSGHSSKFPAIHIIGYVCILV